MNTKTKSTVVLIGVLLIGIIIGALGNSMLRRNIWEDRVAKFRSPQGFADRFIKIIKPDPQQEKALQEILLKHHQKMLSITELSRERMKIHADSLLFDLEPILTSEQFEQAKNILKRRPRHFLGPKERWKDREEE